MSATVVTISASFGAGGSIVGPALAERLGLPLIDRAIPAAVAHSLAVPLNRALAHDERSQSTIGRILAKWATAAIPYGAGPLVTADAVEEPELFQSRTEEFIRGVAATTGGVIIGRAAAIVLADEPSAFHVRLDGPRAARLKRAVEAEGVEAATAESRLDESDRAREAYVRHFYRADARDARWYHLVIDSTVVPIGVCTELILQAVAARRAE